MNTNKRAFIKTIYFGILIGAISLSCNSQTSSAKNTNKADKIEELISNYTSYGKFNGSILVAEEGKIIFKKGFGMADMEWKIPNQTDTKFRIASITKQFTSLLIMQLVAENKLDLQEPISAYLPDYPKKNADRITIHHLLTHTSGTPGFHDFMDYRDMDPYKHSPEDLVKIFAEGDLRFTPGEDYSYTNTGYVLLGVIIEKITGKPYKQMLQDNIFTPLGMLNSGFDDNRVVLENRAKGYTNGYLRNEFYNANYIDMSTPYAAGSIYSTVEDMFLWDQALYTEKLLPQKYIDLLYGKYVSAFNGRHYGYGWIIGGMRVGTTEERVETYSHGGGMPGVRTLFNRIPSTKSSIIMLGNTEKSARFEITNSIIGILENKPYNINKSVAYSLVDVVKKDGIGAGLEYYTEIKGSSDYYMDVDEMNIAGYELLQSDKTEEALFIFKLNVGAFPDSFIPYDSYGEQLLVLGDTTNAIINYKKSVELNPRNKGAVNVLKGLGVMVN
ncbi:MAG: beta-lactamase family protein [Cyclobacteriaceae bacterium]|nr:beta-lactamase family protein [Cyclobacteriaceae bacterium]